MSNIVVFKPRPSLGAVWLAFIGIVMSALPAGMTLPVLDLIPWPLAVLNLGVGLGIGFSFLALAVCFYNMRYELDDEALTLRCGPILNYRIPLNQIREIKRRSLRVSLLSSMRLPGVALFKVYYNDIGNVKMCATAAADRILIIEADGIKYGLTPAEEEKLVDALKVRMGR